MPIFALADADLEIEDTQAVWIAPTAVLIGKVILKRNASVWWGAVLRGDNEPITIGANSNVQDNAVLHTDPGAPLTIGAGVTIGHLAMLHGCVIGADCLIGIRATILNRAEIAPESLVGAHALITERKQFPARSLLTGVPAQISRAITEDQVQGIRASALHYVENWRRYSQGLRPSGQPIG